MAKSSHKSDDNTGTFLPNNHPVSNCFMSTCLSITQNVEKESSKVEGKYN